MVQSPDDDKEFYEYVCESASGGPFWTRMLCQHGRPHPTFPWLICDPTERYRSPLVLGSATAFKTTTPACQHRENYRNRASSHVVRSRPCYGLQDDDASMPTPQKGSKPGFVSHSSVAPAGDPTGSIWQQDRDWDFRPQPVEITHLWTPAEQLKRLWDNWHQTVRKLTTWTQLVLAFARRRRRVSARRSLSPLAGPRRRRGSGSRSPRSRRRRRARKFEPPADALRPRPRRHGTTHAISFIARRGVKYARRAEILRASLAVRPSTGRAATTPRRRRAPATTKT